MQTLQFSSASGWIYSVNLPSPMKGLKSAYLFSFHKSGGTLMHNMVRSYCNPLGFSTCSTFNKAFESSMPINYIQEDAAG